MEYIIVGTTEDNKECLSTVCGKSYENAVKTLDRMLNNPDKYDLHNMKGMNDFRIKEVDDRECWWNDPFLAN